MASSMISEEHIDALSLSIKELTELAQKMGIGMSAHELIRLQKEVLKRPPTVTECQLWSIQGSEHCAYKSSKKYLKELPTKAPYLIVGVGEDAAVISVAEDSQGLRYGIAMSHESHNHPSQVVPFEGAATGVGGNVRDVNCMGAEVIALSDILRFGDLYNEKTQWLNQEVVNGIASYGNALGIPNVTGNVFYHNSYQSNCLVNIVTLGIVREDKVIHSYVPDDADGYVLILVGKPTDNSGFGGASFASSNLEDSDANRGAVQEPNAFLERHLIKANLALMNRLHELGRIKDVAFKDLGAGGVGCASVELADGNGYGAEVFLDEVHQSMEGLHPSVVLCAETQERFMWAVPKDLKDLVLSHYNDTFALPEVSFGAKAKEVGRITKEPQYVVWYQGKKQVDAKASDVTAGLSEDRAVEEPDIKDEIKAKYLDDVPIKEAFLSLLAHENIASDKAIYIQYDKQVQGRTYLERGQGDAGILQPFNSDEYPLEIRKKGIALSVAQSPLKNILNPYQGGIEAVCQAIEKVSAVGCSAIAVTDCLCYGDPTIASHMWAFKEGVFGIKDACTAYPVYDLDGVSLPVVGGNVSLYNTDGTQSIAPSPMVSALAVINDVEKTISYRCEEINEPVFVLRDNRLSLAGSIYQTLYPTTDKLHPIDMNAFHNRVYFMLKAIEKGLVRAASHISFGGLAKALSHLYLASNVGFNICFNNANERALRALLFAETGGFALVVKKEKEAEFLALSKHYHSLPLLVGTTTKDDTFSVQDIFELRRDELAKICSQTLERALL